MANQEIYLKRVMQASENKDITNGANISITYVKKVDMNKGGRARTNKYYGRVTQLVTGNYKIGVDYKNVQNNALEASGSTVVDYTVEKHKYANWLHFPYIKIGYTENTFGKLYLCIFEPKEGFHCNSVYMVDNQKATDEQIAEFTPYIKKSTECKKIDKVSEGTDKLASEEVTMFYRLVTLENVLNLSQVNRVII